MHKARLLVGMLAVAVLSCAAVAQDTKPAAAQDAKLVDAGGPFGQLQLIDEVNCGDAADSHEFTESAPGVSKVEDLLGRACRVLPPPGEPKYFAYRIGKGKGKGLKAGSCYVLTVDYPDDKPRTIYIGNLGCETNLGFGTGKALGDTVYGYTNNNNESLEFPQSGAMQTWRQLFYMHDRLGDVTGIRGDKGKRPFTPADGFWVVIAQPSGADCPATVGAAVAKIRLFEVTDETKLAARYTPVPAGLPQRHLYWREEMADGVIDGDENLRGVTKRVDWYEFKARLMRFLGMNTFSKDLLEFGANQGWDSSIYGGDEWVYQAKDPEMRRIWEDILTMLGKYDYSVLPMYEYCGGKGQKSLGQERRAKTLNGKESYTHITWTEIANADVTDQDTYKDFEKVLDATILRYKDKVKFAGAWLRPRPSGMPIGFGDTTLERFAKEANDGKAITRDELKADKALLEKYYAWWFGKRRDFNVAMRDHMREKGVAGAVVIFGCDTAEPGWSLPGKQLVTDDVPGWTAAMPEFIKEKNSAEPGGPPDKISSYDEVVKSDAYYKSLISMASTWGDWEWQHAVPHADPENYKKTEGVMLSYSFNRAYTVSSPTGFDAFRTPAGLALTCHDALNENMMTIWGADAKENKDLLGYYVCDVERPGPYCMLGEARAMAYGDPTYIGYLWGNNYSRGFPEYARNFNTAFLSLPALPSKVVDGAASDKDVIVRQISTEKNGTYLAVVNVGLKDKKDIAITLPATGKVTNAATGEAIAAADGKVTMSFYPCQLVALHIEAAQGQ